MSIQSTTNRNDYIGNGAANVYPYNFRIFQSSDLLCTVRGMNGSEITLVLNTDYTVSGVGELNGGSITLVNASQSWLTSGFLTTDYSLTIRRVRPLTQETDIRNQGSFLPETHEDAFDHLVMIDQQQQDDLSRSVKLPETISSSAFDATLPSIIGDNPGKALGVNATGDGFELIAQTGAIGLPVSTGNGGTGSSLSLGTNKLIQSSSGSMIEASAITASRLLRSDANGIPVALTAITANRALTSDANGYPVHNPAGVTDTQLGYLPNLFTNKKLELSFVSVSLVDIKENTGIANQTSVRFDDGEVRTVTEDTSVTNKYRRFDITATANFTSGTEDSGLYSGLSEATNTTYAIYAVKSQIDSSKFVLVGRPLTPTSAANIATLNADFGTNSWKYIQLIRNGNNSTATGDIVSFVQSGNLTLFNAPAGSSATRGWGTVLNSVSGGGAATLTYTYSSGFGTTDIAPNILVGKFIIHTDAAAATSVYVADAADTGLYATTFDNSVGGGASFDAPAAKGIKLSTSSAGNAHMFIYLAGFYDSLL